MNKQNINPIEVRDFTADEVNEIHQYIAANVPYTILSTIFVLTENAYQKAQAFTIIYRILNGSRNYVENVVTREKLDRLLNECKDTYEELYNLISITEMSTNSYGSHMLKYQMKNIFIDYEKSFKINKMIDAFLIFGEKLVLLETNKVAGLEIDTEEGREMYKKIVSGSDTTPKLE